MKSNSRKYVEFGVLLALAIAIFWWFGRNLDWKEVTQALRQTDFSLLAVAVAVICVAYGFRAIRWGALLAPLGPTRLKHLFAATTVGFGAVFLVGRMGEVVRPVYLPMRDPTVRPSASFVTILVERIYDLVAVVVLFAANLIWFKPSGNIETEFAQVRTAGITLLILALASVAGLIWFRSRSASAVGWLEKRFNRWQFIPQSVRRAVVALVEQLARALRVLVDARELAVTIGWTASVWISIAIANLLVLRAFGLPFGIGETLFVLGWSLVGSLVPTPGGAAGAFHAATAASLVFLGVAKETAAAISIVLHLVDFGPAVVIGFFYFVRGDINLKRLRTLASPEAVEHAVEDESIASEEVLGDQKLQAVGTSD
ncbi:MAG TPA: lysylphosphatidylglycerol synthase transmembrane domain-containing protein [Pyrinomonadaceae bacterium]|nr:lysylphosphatidylglycerol synthase transmembrane domain-containing protein [Pyrinomonadaceae bacterium]